MTDLAGKTPGDVKLAIGEREMGEGLESSEKNFEEFDFKCGQTPAAESLLRETISQLETALRESTKLLAQRDNEINTLRNDLGLCRGDRENNISATLEEEVKKSQMRVIDLEKVIQQLQQDIAMYKLNGKPWQRKNKNMKGVSLAKLVIVARCVVP